MQGVLAEAVPTTYVWTTTDGIELLKGADYTESNGVFQFAGGYPQGIVCTMTTTAFPKFTGANVLKTTAIIVDFPNSIDSQSADKIEVVGKTNEVSIENLASGEAIKIVNLSGAVVYVATANGSEVSINLSAGVYIVLVDEVAHKVIVK